MGIIDLGASLYTLFFFMRWSARCCAFAWWARFRSGTPSPSRYRQDVLPYSSDAERLPVGGLATTEPTHHALELLEALEERRMVEEVGVEQVDPLLHDLNNPAIVSIDELSSNIKARVR